MSERSVDYGNEKLNTIFDLTWPNLGWAKKDTEEKQSEPESSQDIYSDSQ